MNIYATVILATLLVSFALDLASSLLNLRCLRPELPAEFDGIFDGEAYARSQRYTRERTRFGLAHDAFGLVIMLSFWFLGGFDLLDRWVRGLDLGMIPSGLLYIGALAVGLGLLNLPFKIYSTFVIEERYGFNKTTVGTFIADRIKGLLLGVVIGGALLAAILFLLDRAGEYAWLWCWAVTSLFSLFLQIVFPTWILPLFNKFSPLEEGELRGAIVEYAERVRFPLRNIFVIDGSRRSSKSNAFFTGFGSQKRLALYDTLVEQQTTAELVAVVAHEVGHYKKRHILKGLAIGVLHSGVLFFLLSLFLTRPGLFEAFYMEEMSIYAGLVFFGMLFSPIDMILSIGLQAFSRKNEYEADRFAAETIEDRENMVSALRKLSRDNLVNLTPHPFHVFLHYSHPPVLERIRAIRAAGTGAS